MKTKTPIYGAIASVAVTIITFVVLNLMNYAPTPQMLILSIALGLVVTHLIFLYAADRRRKKHTGKTGNAKRIKQRDKDFNILFLFTLILVYVPIYRIYRDIGDVFIVLVGAVVIASIINGLYFWLKYRRKK